MEDAEAVAEPVTALVPTAVEPVSFQMSPLIVAESDPHGSAAESIHALRTHLLARHLQVGRRSIVVCETGDAGGLFLATNLAISFAQAGVRTLLIDGDLRRARLGELITPSEPVLGLTDIIDRPDLAIGAAIQRVLPNFSVMFAGDTLGRSQELLATPRFAQICDLCLRDFDLTIATAPPANFYADARQLASLLRYVMIVARRDVTFIDDLKALLGELSSDGARVIGTVYNDF